MFQELKLVFHAHSRVKRYENRSKSEHMLKLSGYYNRLNQVGVNLPDKIVIDRIL